MVRDTQAAIPLALIFKIYFTEGNFDWLSAEVFAIP